MRMKLIDQSTYPRFTRYIKNQISRVVTVSRIMNAYQDITQVGEAIIRKGLQWNNPPDLEIHPHLLSAMGIKGWNPHKDLVIIARDLVINFEKPPDKKYYDVSPVAGNRWAYKIGIVLLHEMAHWSARMAGTYKKSVEEGDLFERRVYGYVTP